MNINNAYPSRFLRSADIEGDQTYTIKNIEVETVGQGKDAEEKPIVYFEEVEQGLALNKTNANAIAALYGPETDAWPGKRVTLFSTEVEFAGKMTLAIRVRLKAPGSGKAAPKSAPPADDFPKNADPVAAAKMQAWNAFMAKWTAFRAENPAEGTVANRNAKWLAACTDYQETMRKSEEQMTEADWRALAQEIEKNYHVASGTMLPI